MKKKEFEKEDSLPDLGASGTCSEEWSTKEESAQEEEFENCGWPQHGMDMFEKGSIVNIKRSDGKFKQLFLMIGKEFPASTPGTTQGSRLGWGQGRGWTEDSLTDCCCSVWGEVEKGKLLTAFALLEGSLERMRERVLKGGASVAK